MEKNNTPIKLCVIGCGVQTEQAYLPILSGINECKIESLIDIDLIRCRMLAKHYNIPHYAQMIDDIPSTVDAAIVVLPNYLHSPVSCELMKKKLHVLCEKPMATTKTDAETMIRCAQENGVQLCIGNIFRFYWTSRYVKEVIDSKTFGDLISFHIEEGKNFVWPTSSGFYYDKEKAGGGVLIDTGAHVLDLVLWWLGDYPTVVDYQDDNFGGVEAECYLELRFATAVHGSVKLSRLGKLQNKYTLAFEHGTVTFQPYDPSGISNTITIYRNGQESKLKAKRNLWYHDYFRQELETFLCTIKTGEASTIAADSVIPSIQLIDECYQNATRFELPWVYYKTTDKVFTYRMDSNIDIKKAKILITGASGFIGGRIAERLYFDYGTIPRCLVKNFYKLSRLSRFPTEIVCCDILDSNSLLKATAACDVVIHAAYGNTPDDNLNVRINTIGTENIIRASLQNEVKRFIYLSSVEVYGENQPSIVNEQTAINYSENSYGRSKLDAEKLCLRYFHEYSLPVIILRPSVVYGPHAPIWTVDVINRLLSRGFCLSDEFNGICNLIYIDDCVDAIFLAMSRDDIMGENFIVSSGEQITWNKYFSKYNEILNMPPLEIASKNRLQLYRLIRRTFDIFYNNLQPKYGNDIFLTYSRLRERRQLPNLKSLLQKGSLLDALNIFNRSTYYSIEKAQRKLEFEPKYDFDSGMTLVKQWLLHMSQIQN